MATDKRYTINIDTSDPKHRLVSEFLDRIRSKGGQTELIVNLIHMHVDMTRVPEDEILRIREAYFQETQGMRCARVVGASVGDVVERRQDSKVEKPAAEAGRGALRGLSIPVEGNE